MDDNEVIDDEVQQEVDRQLLQQGVENLAHGIPLLLVAVAVIAQMGSRVGRDEIVVTFGALAVLVSGWRWLIHGRYRKLPRGTPLSRVRWELEGNAALTGCMWTLATFALYPVLHARDAALYVGIVSGSVGIAAFSLGLAGKAFAWLTLLQVGAMAAVSLLLDAVQSVSLAALMMLFALVMLHGARSIRSMEANAIRRQIELDHANESLRVAKQAAEEANAAKTAFLANVSHEIRTPLTAIIGFSQDGEAHADEARRLEDLQAIERAGHHLLGLVDDLLDLARAESGRFECDCQPVPLRPLVEQAVEMVSARALDKRIALLVHWPDGGDDPVALADPLRLRQVLLNLLGNALKFTDHGRIDILVGRSAADRLQISVEDTGPGIAAATLQSLFVPFNRGEARTARKAPGLGLGLALSRRLVQSMGGSLWASSRVGVGSRFTLELAVAELGTSPSATLLDDVDAAPGCPHVASARTQDPVCATGPSSVNERPPSAPPPHLLLVEDNADNRRLIVRFAEAAGASVECVEDGNTGRALALSRPHTLLLMDVQLPDADGIELVRGLRQAGYDRPVVVLTAAASREQGRRAIAAGADAFLAKPLHRPTFVALLERLVAQGPSLSALSPAVHSTLLDEDPELTDLVAYFVRRLPALVDGIGLARRGDDEAAFLQRLHDLKSLGGSYGFPQLSVLAEALMARTPEPDRERLFLRLAEQATRIHAHALATLPCHVA